MTDMWTEPPEEQELEKAKGFIVGQVPTMTPAVDPKVHLFRGLLSPTDSRFHTEAIVHELTGSDEEAIARMMSGDAVQFINAVLAYGVDSIGTQDLESLPLAERQGLLDNLLVGEKEILFLAVLKVTYGDERTISLRCPTCNESNEVSFSLSEDIPIKGMDDPTKPTYEFITRSGDNIEYRLVTGADQAETQKRRSITLPEADTIFLTRCIETVNGKPLVDPQHFAREMGAVDRRNLLREITSRQPGPQFEEVKLPCASCGAEATYTPSWADLLST